MLNRLQDVFEFFQQHEVRYMVIAGVASVLYGVPRATFDLDILIEATTKNAQRPYLADQGLNRSVFKPPAGKIRPLT